MKLLAYTLLVVAIVTTASAESMMDAFRKFRDKKANQHRLPGSVKGVICEKTGRQPKSYCCFNKHGVRCSPDFQREGGLGAYKKRSFLDIATKKPVLKKGTCPGAGCQTETVGRCPRNRGPGESCSCRRLKDGRVCTRIHSCKDNGDIQQSLCAQPCGCVLDGQPKRESSGTMKTQNIPGECGSQHVLNQMKNVLRSWKVPGDAMNKFEMAAMFNSAQFTVFDLFIQPKRNQARYKLSVGAARCHANHVEIGYMDTGMWKVDTVNNYKCSHHRRGTCTGVGIPPESIEKARKALEWYAWKNLKVGRRRLVEVGDNIEDIGLHTVEFDSEESLGSTLRGSWSDFEERTLEERVMENELNEYMQW